MSNIEVSPLIMEKLQTLFQKVFSSETETAKFLNDPGGAFAAHDIEPSVFGDVDINQLVNSCASGGGAAGGGGGGGAGGGGGYTPAPQAVQQVSQVTQNYYQDNSTNILDNSTNIDNSVDVSVDGPMLGDIDVDSTNLNQVGDGNVGNIGDGDVFAATGDGSGVEYVGGDKIAAGDGAVIGTGSGDVVGATGTGAFAGSSTFGDVVGNTGDHAVTAGGDIAGPVNINFGDGDQQNVTDSHVQDSAMSAGGDATNVQDSYNEDIAAPPPPEPPQPPPLPDPVITDAPASQPAEDPVL